MAKTADSIISQIPMRKVWRLNFFIVLFVGILLIVPFMVQKEGTHDVLVYLTPGKDAYSVFSHAEIDGCLFDTIQLMEHDKDRYNILYVKYEDRYCDASNHVDIIHWKVSYKYSDIKSPFVVIKGKIQERKDTWGKAIFKK